MSKCSAVPQRGVWACEGYSTGVGRRTDQRDWRRRHHSSLIWASPIGSHTHPVDPPLYILSPFGPLRAPLIKHPLPSRGHPLGPPCKDPSRTCWPPALVFCFCLEKEEVLAPWEEERHKHILSTRDNCGWVPKLTGPINYTFLGYIVLSSMRKLYFRH